MTSPDRPTTPTRPPCPHDGRSTVLSITGVYHVRDGIHVLTGQVERRRCFRCGKSFEREVAA